MTTTLDVRPTRFAGRARGTLDALVRSVGPIVLALLSAGVLLALIGRDPIAFFQDVLTAGVFRWNGLQDTITRTAPVLLVGAGLAYAAVVALFFDRKAAHEEAWLEAKYRDDYVAYKKRVKKLLPWIY